MSSGEKRVHVTEQEVSPNSPPSKKWATTAKTVDKWKKDTQQLAGYGDMATLQDGRSQPHAQP